MYVYISIHTHTHTHTHTYTHIYTHTHTHTHTDEGLEELVSDVALAVLRCEQDWISARNSQKSAH